MELMFYILCFICDEIYFLIINLLWEDMDIFLLDITLCFKIFKFLLSYTVSIDNLITFSLFISLFFLIIIVVIVVFASYNDVFDNIRIMKKIHKKNGEY